MNLAGLYRLVPKQSHIAEVGVWEGRNALLLDKVIQPDKLFLIDNWQMPDETNEQVMGTDLEKIESLYPSVVKYFAAKRNVVVLRMDSVEAAYMFRPRYLDMVFIDASHRYDNVLADLFSWSRVVKVGGLLCGHDWDYYPDVNRAVDTFLKKFPSCRLERTATDRDGIGAYAIRIGE